MKKYFLIISILCCQNLFSQTPAQQLIDTSRLYINFMSANYKPTVATVYIFGGMQTPFSQTMQIPNNSFMWFRCSATAPCKVAVDANDKLNGLNAMLNNKQFNNGDSVIVNIDARTVTIINRKTTR